jgi:hypothetical protein
VSDYPFQAEFRAPYDPTVDKSLLEEIRGMPEHVRDSLRSKCKHDRYFLAKGILGYQDVNPYTHGPMCRAMENKAFTRRMCLSPRGHLKTTLFTITDMVGDALADPEEFRGLIINEIELNAIGFLSEIKAHFENNDLIRELFPDLIPKKFGGPGSKWSTAQACLNRHTSYKEWTWTAAGVGKALAGNHYKKIKCDDLIGFEAKESPAAMRYAIAFAKALEPLLISMDDDYIDFVGTRWAIYDLYREMLKVYETEMLYFAREDIEVVPDLPEELLREVGFKFEDKQEIVGTRQPIFPKKFSLKQLARMARIDPVLYYAQYKNNPIADGIKDFDATKLRWCDVDRHGNIVYRDDNGLIQRWTREGLDIVMTVDPNSGDLTAPDFPAIIVAAYSPLNQMFVLDTWSRRVQPDAFTQRIFEMWEQWQPRVCGIEKAGQQSTAFYFKKLAKERKTYINVEPLHHKNREKSVRIRKALQPILNEGRLYVRKVQTQLQHQFRFHPDLDNDDEIDAAAYATELFIVPSGQQDREEEEEAAKKVMAARNPRTGYGR